MGLRTLPIPFSPWSGPVGKGWGLIGLGPRYECYQSKEIGIPFPPNSPYRGYSSAVPDSAMNIGTRNCERGPKRKL